MAKIDDFVNEYLIVEYSTDYQALYLLISKVENNTIYAMVSPEFEKTGLLVDDIVKCKIDRQDVEYFFEAKITGMEIEQEGLYLELKPTTEVEQFFNLRSEKRINFKLVAFLNEDNMASVSNVSKSGLLVVSKESFQKGDEINIKLIISLPYKECNFTGTIVRAQESENNKKEYGIQINQFESDEDEKKYKEFISKLVEEFNLF